MLVAEAAADELHSLVIFRLGGQLFAIPVETVREVVPYAWLAQPPRMPSFVQGVLNLGGAAVPVLRLDRLLGMAPGPIGLGASILIMKTSAAPVGLLVDHVDGVQSAAGLQRMPVDERHSFQGCLAGVLAGATGEINLLSWRGVLLEEERLRLDGFQSDAQARLAELGDDRS